MPKIQLYKWCVNSDLEAFGVVYSCENARDRLVARMERATGKLITCGKAFPLSVVKDTQIRKGWRKNALECGAILATGLGAF